MLAPPAASWLCYPQSAQRTLTSILNALSASCLFSWSALFNVAHTPRFFSSSIEMLHSVTDENPSFEFRPPQLNPRVSRSAKLSRSVKTYNEPDLSDKNSHRLSIGPTVYNRVSLPQH
ncbi:hypothetical protein FGIG_01059 [Fasciola gigantica]|uniref:Uncharacterized protein n=1 Tax=Fasciola gigantica TaxID=46835 RepID=A0A504YU30_FASGI|nr:hypothetical protein FGIG_01059 [Fasciola gigantica]